MQSTDTTMASWVVSGSTETTDRKVLPPQVAGPPSAATNAGLWTSDGADRMHVELFRLTDTLVLLGVMAAAFIRTDLPDGRAVEQFFAARITLKNMILVIGYVLIWQQILTAATSYQRQRGAGWQHEVLAVVVGCTLAAAVAAVIPLTGLSRHFGLGTVALAWAASVPSILLTRRAVRASVRLVRRSAVPRTVLIVGSGPRAVAAYHRVQDQPDYGYRVVGFVDSNDEIAFDEVRQRLLGRLEDLETLLMHSSVDVVLITLPAKSSYDRIEHVIDVCERIGVESRYLADTFKGSFGRRSFAATGPMPAVAVKVVADDARLRLKRTFDVAASSLLLLLLLPLFLTVAAAIRLSAPGPVFFAQERFGLNRRTFRMYKFRTMVCNAEALQESIEHLNEATGPVFKIRDDPRTTCVGRLLRRTSIDELPQLLNVLRGDMSLVGPRPLPLRDVHHFGEAALMRRFSVLPGITGLWQISGRSALGFEDWIALDLKYIDNWSLRLDLWILLRTIPAVLAGRGAA